MRRILISAAILVVIGIIGAQAVKLASVKVSEAIRERAAERNIPVTVENLALGWRGIHVDGMCVTEREGADPLAACASDVRVSARLLDVLRGRPQVERIDIGSVTILGTGENGTFQGAAEYVRTMFGGDDRPTPDPEGSGGEPRARGEGPQLSDMPTIAIGQVEWTMNDDQPMGRGTLSAIRVEPSGDGVSFSVGLTQSSTQIRDGLRVRLGDGATLTGEFTDPQTWHVSLEGAEDRAGITARTEAGPIDLSFVSLSIEAPRTLRLGDVQVMTTLGPSFSAEEIELELREFTTELEDLYFARARIAAPELTIPVNEAGSLVLVPTRVNAAADGSGEGSGDPGSPDVAPADEGSGGAADEVPSDESATQGPPLWAGREWWEKLPQQITIERGSVVLLLPDEETLGLQLSDIEVAYALRAIRTQMDLEASTQLLVGEGVSGGTLKVEAVWNWAEQALDATLDVTDLSLTAVATVVPALRPFAPDGTVDLALRFVEQPDGAIPTFTGRIDADMLSAQLPNVTNRIVAEKFVYSWSATRTADDPTDALRFQSGEGQIANMQFGLTPVIHGFDYENPYLGDGVDVVFSVPDQDGMALLYSIPAALLGPLRYASLDGTWGMDVAFPITFEDADPETGRRPIEIGAPTRYEVRDTSLHLLELPPDFDVRRLNTGMDFIFRGPPETAERRLTIPPPTATAPDGANGLAEGAADGAGVRWANLGDISYFVIAATLYREDGRFFRNYGINWYQLRAVLEEAWQEGRLGRGASTISMQTVKNVFLTHERSIERKVQELFLTYWMTRLVPKDRILEVYLNIIEWGPGINGIVEAAEYYFGKSPSELSLAESVWLSSIVPAPVRRSAQRSAGQPAEWSNRHSRDIMQGMHSRGWITSAELGKGLTADVRFVTAEPLVGERPPREVDWQALGLDDLRVTSDVGAPTGGADQPGLSVPPQQRIRQLVSSQIPLRP